MPYIDDIFPEDDESTFDPETDILELMGLDQPGGGDTFGLETAEATLVYLFDWKKARSFIRWCLGFSYADQTSPYKMYRENPQQHPKYGWLTASTVHFSAVAPKANPDNVTVSNPGGAPNVPSMYTTDGGINKAGQYDKVYATVRFVDQPWTFRPDAYVTSSADEFGRNTYFTPVPTQEMLSAEGATAQLKFIQTGTGGPTLTGGAEVITNLFGTLVNKVTFTLNWMWVAESYLSSDPTFFFPRKVLNCVGRVNSAKFGPFPAGSVLCQPPKFERFRFPVGTFDDLNPFYGWNVRVPLTYFDPDRGVPRDTGTYPTQDAEDAVNSIPRGYRLMPWRGNLKWYEAARDDGVTHLLPEADINQMFQHISE